VNKEVWLEKAARNLKTSKLVLDDGDAGSACNRAYYCMFDAARAALLIVGQPERAMGKTHSGMIASFGEFLVKSGIVAAENGRNFSFESNRRMASDYDATEMSIDDATVAIANAERFLAAVKQLDSAQQ
jgi:uncharacterized protein (UPF0332 family)